MRAVLKNTRISPLKARVIARMLKGKTVEDALNMLKMTPKKGASILYKVISSASANAKNNFGQNINSLEIANIQIDKGMVLKRSLPRSRGRTSPIMKRTSNIKVEVKAKTPKKETKKNLKPQTNK